MRKGIGQTLMFGNGWHGKSQGGKSWQWTCEYYQGKGCPDPKPNPSGTRGRDATW